MDGVQKGGLSPVVGGMVVRARWYCCVRCTWREAEQPGKDVAELARAVRTRLEVQPLLRRPVARRQPTGSRNAAVAAGLLLCAEEVPVPCPPPKVGE